MKKIILQNIFEKIKSADNFLITSHVHFDGDSIGSQLAMAHILKHFKKRFYIYDQDRPSGYLNFIPNLRYINTVPPKDKENYEELIVIDAPFNERIGKEVFNELSYIDKENIIIFDHHPNPQINTKSYIKTDVSSTGELIYDFMEYADVPIYPETALYLYVSIFTDTYGFRQANTTSRALYIASKLYSKLPMSYTKIIESLYENNRYEGLQLLEDFIANSNLDKRYGIIHSYITKALMKKYKVNNNDLEYYINYLRSVRGVKVACIFKETKNKTIKVNLRAKGDNIDLTPFVKKYNGGGHPKAAGFIIEEGELKEKMEEVLESLKIFLTKGIV